MSLAIRLKADNLRYRAFGSITGSYTGLGTDGTTGAGSGMTKPIRQIFLQNLTDATLMFSLDGIRDAFPLPANGFFVSDITANKTIDTGFFLAEGQVIYVKTLGSPSSGAVYLAAFYGTEV